VSARLIYLASREELISTPGSHVDTRLSQHDRRVWTFVSNSPLRSLWNLRGIPARVVAKRAWKSIMEDRIFGHAAELGFYFLFALFPTLFSASSILGLIAQSATRIYDRLLHYVALVLPTQAFGIVLRTFNETTSHSTSGKLTFGLIAAIWSASVGISALQDTLNAVYKIEESRSYLKARLEAIGLTILLMFIITGCLASMLGGDFLAAVARHRIREAFLQMAAVITARFAGWIIATGLLALSFAVIYYWAPDLKTRSWHWLTPGGAIGIIAWLVASLGLRIYLSFYNSYSVTYGSLGAVIILLTWFYLTGLMLLMGAEINSEIEAAAAERKVNQASPAAEAEMPVRSGSDMSAAAD
jgi:membrane protein